VGAATEPYPSTFQSADAAVLQPVAALANGNLTSVYFIPGGWQILKVVPNTGQPNGTQFLVLLNTLPSNPSQTVAVIAFGQSWDGVLGPQYMTPSPPGSGPADVGYALDTLDPLLGGPDPSPIGPPPDGTPLFSSAYQQQYLQQTEARLFQVLSLPTIAAAVNGLPLIVVGQAQGAPLAQLAALAFRSSRSGLPANINTAACFTFATPPLGDTNFDALLQQLVPASFNVYATTATSSTIDFFATPAVPFASGTRCGQPTPVTGTIPAPDDPWFEHSGAFYTTLLGGTPSGHTTPGTVQSPPTTYSADFASTLAGLCAVAYQQAQHPDLAPPSVPGYVLDSVASANGVRWAAIFVNGANTRVIVAFRGACGFEETVNAVTQFNVVYPSYLKNSAAIAPGLDQIYTPMRTSLRAAVVSALAKAGNAPSVVVTGHDVGGALANIAALDFATNGGGISAPAFVYTFAAPPSGDPVFQNDFTSRFGSSTRPLSFQLMRPGDPFASILVFGGTQSMPVGLVLTGATPSDEGVNHSLTSYITLLGG
jgi:hypothetical protein